MSTYIGNNEISSIYVGNSEITSIYVGTDLVYSSGVDYLRFTSQQDNSSVAGSGTFYNYGGASYPSGTNGIPSGWTEVTQ